jgi:CHAT domain-containing protein
MRIATGQLVRTALAGLLAAWLALLGMAANAQPVVEAVTRLASASAPDLKAGDRLLRARGPGGEVAFDSIAAVVRFQWQQLPLGRADLEIERDGERRWIAWTPMSVELQLRPSPGAEGLLSDLDRALLALRSTREQPQSDAGRKVWEEAWSLVSQTPALAEWRALTAVFAARAALMARGAGEEVLARLAMIDGITVDPVLRAAGEEARVRVWMERRELDRIVAALAPLAARTGSGGQLHAWDAQLLVRLAWAHGQRGEFALGLAQLKRACGAFASLCADCLEAAVALDATAQMHSQLDQPDQAMALQEELYRTWQALMPGSLNAALSGLKLAGYASSAGDHARALVVAGEAAALVESLESAAYYRAAAANVLGTQLAHAGRAGEAEAQFRHGLVLLGDSAPERSVRAQLQHNLGLMLKESGRLAESYASLLAAESEYRAQKQMRGSEYAAVAANVANLERLRGDYNAAAQWLGRSLEAMAEAPSMGPRRVHTLIDQAELDLQRGQRDAALAGFARASAAAGQTEPDCECRAQAGLHHGRALADSDPAHALELLQRAEAGFERVQRPLDVARTAMARASALSALGRHAAARSAVGEALATWQRIFPDSVEHAEALHRSGRIEAAAGRPRAARQAWCAAADVLDSASFSLGADDYAQMRFRARFVDVYRDCMLATLDARGAAAALEVLQRAHRIAWRQGRELRARVAADPVARQQSRDYESAWQTLNDAGDASERDAALARVEELRRERAERMAGAGRAESGAGVALAPGDAAEALLVYALGEHRSVVFLLRSGLPTEALSLPLERAQLRQAVRDWRALIGRRDVRDLAAIHAQGDALYQQLLAPLGARIDPYKRIAIVADDVLHELPFAALWDARRGEYLVQRASVRLRDGLGEPGTRAGAGGAWLALGDAAIGDLGGTPALAWTRAGATLLAPLPGARREVLALARRDARMHALVGADASEAQLKAAAPRAALLHLAVHTLTDPANPLDSALLLAPGGAENGWLQVWEVQEQLQLRADLVVLSGCETALGGNFDGEGVVGFVRAFRGAGARSVVASLWQTHDATTADLVGRFYAARADSGDPADALRSAMLQLLHSADAGRDDTVRGVGGVAPAAAASARLDHPWYWAALQVHEG